VGSLQQQQQYPHTLPILTKVTQKANKICLTYDVKAALTLGGSTETDFFHSWPHSRMVEVETPWYTRDKPVINK
jgi:hypothetical protein